MLRSKEAGARRPSSLLAPVLILLLATGLRFYRLAGQSLWSDEGNSVALARAGLAEIAARTALDIHPPLYYWLLHGWLRVFGQSETAVRSLSAVASVVLVAVVYRLGTRLFGKRAGRLATLIAAVSPFQVYYAQETRMYTLLTLLGALAVWATVEWVGARSPLPGRERGRGRGSAWALLYVLSATLGLYTHYAFPVVLVATNLAVLVHLWQARAAGHAARRLASWLLLQLVPLALYLPWLPVAWRQLTTWPAPSPASAGNAFVTVWNTLILGPAGGRGEPLGGMPSPLGGMPSPLGGMPSPLLVGFGLLGLIGTVYLLRRGPWPKAVLVLLYLGLPVGLTLILFKSAYLKFLLVASPALCLLLALGLTAGWVGRGRPGKGDSSWVYFHAAQWLGVILVVAAAWWPLTTYYADPTVARDDYRGIARYLGAVAGPGDAVLLNAAGQQEVFGYYYRGAAPVYPLPRRRPLDPNATVAELEAILAQTRYVYALYWATDESDPAGIIENWLNEHAFKATEAWVGNVRLVSYAAPLPAGDLLPINVRLGDHVTLIGYQLLPARAVPGEIVQVQLRWLTDAPLAARYVVFVQALDGANHLVGQRDAEPVPPSVDWTPGQPVLGRYGLLIEPGTPPGEQRVIVGMYDAASGQRLPTPAGNFVELGTIAVERLATPPPVTALRFRHPASADIGPLHLLGYDRYKLGHSYDPDTPLHPGDPLHVVLYWQTQSQLQTDWRVTLRLAPAADLSSPVAEGIFPAAGVDYPATHWEPGEITRAQFDLFLPGDTPPGNYQVSLRLLDEAGSPGGDTLSLAPISVE